MKKLHVAIGTADIDASVVDYSKRLGQAPEVVVPGNYALWRTEALNLSVRVTGPDEAGKLRHLGFETADAANFTAEVDCNGITWEEFSADQQQQEILEAWPDAFRGKKI